MVAVPGRGPAAAGGVGALVFRALVLAEALLAAKASCIGVGMAGLGSRGGELKPRGSTNPPPAKSQEQYMAVVLATQQG